MDEVTKRCIYNICVNHKDFILVDVMNHLFRFLWAYPQLSVNIKDEIMQTGDIYGFTKHILYLRDHFPDCAILLAFDGYDSERRKINPEYKAGRANHVNIYKHVGIIRDLCSLVRGVYSCYDKNFEADDVIHAVSSTVKGLCDKKGIRKNIYILSNDKDMYQLVRDGENCSVKVVRKFGSGSDWWSGAEIISESQVRETFNGVGPENVVKFRAITGDSSDNLKGYYRFRKANASIIAENFDYDRENKKLVLKEGVTYKPAWEKFLSVVTKDMNTFSNNYDIMKMKSFDFSILPINEKDYIKDIDYLIKILNVFQMNQFKQKICTGSYSPYRLDIIKRL